MLVKGEALADVQTAHDFEAHAVDQTRASTIGDEQSLDSAIMVVPRHPLKGDGIEDLTHESAHREDADVPLQHRARLHDNVVAGHHGQALFRHPPPANHGVDVHVVAVFEQDDEER